MAGKTINELDARTMPNGKENIPFRKGIQTEDYLPMR